MSATTTAYLIQAIEEVLTSTTGKVRQLAAGHQFGQGLPPDVEPQLRSVRCLDHANKKAAFVSVESMIAIDEVATELGSDHLYGLLVVVSCDYHLGWQMSHDEEKAARILAQDDFPRIREALCHPAALDATVGLVATGIPHGGLKPTAAEWKPRSIGADRDRLLHAEARFTCAWLFTTSS
jgi:hypothetical protein